MLLAIIEEILKLIFRREPTGRAGFADFLPPRSGGRFVAEDDVAALGSEPLAEAFRLSGFTGAVNPLDDDEKSLGHRSKIAGF